MQSYTTTTTIIIILFVLIVHLKNRKEKRNVKTQTVHRNS